MRKKSHISLAMHIVDSLDIKELDKHRKAFYIGSILPDCKPSFLTTKHEFYGTISMLHEKIHEMTMEYNSNKFNERSFIMDLGQVLHYIADYFTFPHNMTYDGTLRDHCIYEKELKHSLRAYIKNGEAQKAYAPAKGIDTPEALFHFIDKAHQDYLKLKRSVEEDCMYIVRVCHQVAEAILALFLKEKYSHYTFSSVLC